MDFFWTRRSMMENVVELNLGEGLGNYSGYSCQRLFQKVLTHSDVGDLNRFVIPKKSAIMYFPPIPAFESAGKDVGAVNHIQLEFFDRKMMSWKLKYYYWKSSQSFVFTKGWKWFVKEKQLEVKDVVTFYSCENPKEHQNFFVIDVEKKAANTRNGTVEEPAAFGGRIMGQRLNFRGSFVGDMDRAEEQEEKVVMALGPPLQEKKKKERKKKFGFPQLSSDRMFYGPGAPYAWFAGRDASRALALMFFDPNDLTGNIEGLSRSELEVLQDWEYKFMEKYPKVGLLVTDKTTAEGTEIDMKLKTETAETNIRTI